MQFPYLSSLASTLGVVRGDSVDLAEAEPRFFKTARETTRSAAVHPRMQSILVTQLHPFAQSALVCVQFHSIGYATLSIEALSCRIKLELQIDGSRLMGADIN